MEISINTHKDSKEDIRKLAQFLLSLDGNSGGIRINDRVERKIQKSRNIFEDPNPSSMALGTTPEPEQPAANAFAGMFGDSSPSTLSTDSNLQTFDVKSLFDEEKKEDDTPKIVPY